jgi:hypothetical protein
MDELRLEILQRRLDHILGEWPWASDRERDGLISEAVVIWRDIRAIQLSDAGVAAAC